MNKIDKIKMNLLDFKVAKVISKPVYKYEKWFVEVEYFDHWIEKPCFTELMFQTLEEALACDVGYEFLH